MEEQQVIVAQITRLCRPIDSRSALTGREIKLLREYRPRLVADVVTGKLDVRGVAERLPEMDLPTAQADADHTLDTDTNSGLEEPDVIVEEAGA